MATVIITVPEDSGYVWEKETRESSASVTVTMMPGYELLPDRVAAIKNLVAYSVTPQMKPENVKVIDAATGVEILPDQDMAMGGLDIRRLEFEKRMQKEIEDNVKRLLSPVYGPDGVVAVAKVTLDYDKMLTQEHHILAGDDGNGTKKSFDEQYSVNANVPAAGIAGEENNTDIPVYAAQDGAQNGDVTDYSRSIEWENSFIDRQIEKGEAILKDASVSVIVDDPTLDEQRREDIVELVSKSVAIDEASISVKNLAYMSAPEVVQASTAAYPFSDDDLLLIAAVGGVVLILIIILLVVFARRRAAKRRAVREALDAMKAAENEANNNKTVEPTGDLHKQISKENAIIKEISQFSRENPVITAAIIHSMLKEDE